VTAPDEELPQLRRRLRRSSVIAVCAVVVAVLAGWLGLSQLRQHHSHRPAPPPPAGAMIASGSCGQDLTRVPGEGSGPLDGGLLVTDAHISPVDRPRFESIAVAGRWLPADAPVIVVQVGRVARAYPLAILQWHEVVNDTMAGRPLAITYCPLCNTAAVYSRLVAGKPVTLGSSGALLSGAAVLTASGTEQLWSQASGEALQAAPAALKWSPSDTLSLSDAAAAYPGLHVLARPYPSFDYTKSPYGDVASPGSMPRLFLGWVDEHLDPKARLVGVVVRGNARAWQYRALAVQRVHNDTVGGQPVVVVYRPNVTGVGNSSDLRHTPQVGTAAVYDVRAAGRTLHFRPAGRHAMRDQETGSTWDLTGRAIAGPLASTRLRPLQFLNTYWFAWVAFHGKTTVWPPVSTSACSAPRH
jgi:Protein of unknown function (DUF3179)